MAKDRASRFLKFHEKKKSHKWHSVKRSVTHHTYLPFYRDCPDLQLSKWQRSGLPISEISWKKEKKEVRSFWREKKKYLFKITTDPVWRIHTLWSDGNYYWNGGFYFTKAYNCILCYHFFKANMYMLETCETSIMCTVCTTRVHIIYNTFTVSYQFLQYGWWYFLISNIFDSS